MIFQPQSVDSSWDTWIYYNDNQYFLYYLVSSEKCWNGFGVATSLDCINWRDYGQVLFASDKMINYLGTGSTWKSPNYDNDKLFFCNYSEWREVNSRSEQIIMFAKSYDLIHWYKIEPEIFFRSDNRYYTSYEDEQGRWDCIFTLPKKGAGYYGYFTAKVKGAIGFGYAESDDGIHWKALKPPILDFGKYKINEEVEVGAIYEHNSKYYCLLGAAKNKCGMCVVTSDNPGGPFKSMNKNFELLSNNNYMNAYFMRFFQTPEGLFVNHHAITRIKNKNGHVMTYLAPIKRVIFDNEGILWLVWWNQNENLKGEQFLYLPTVDQKSFIFEAKGTDEAMISLVLENNSKLNIRIHKNGVIEYIYFNVNEESTDETCKKNILFSDKYSIKLLVHNDLTELYIDDYFITCYTLKNEFVSISTNSNVTNICSWILYKQ